ncbi:hypothetical protein BMS3Bbin06_00157 [bacterium BMS3Bbin06]|nr:hypothetical protein BMS3Bbin06_00157 [bacterium BMS3Bbin06]
MKGGYRGIYAALRIISGVKCGETSEFGTKLAIFLVKYPICVMKEKSFPSMQNSLAMPS